jgi:hypothetical protein
LPAWRGPRPRVPGAASRSGDQPSIPRGERPSAPPTRSAGWPARRGRGVQCQCRDRSPLPRLRLRSARPPLDRLQRPKGRPAGAFSTKDRGRTTPKKNLGVNFSPAGPERLGSERPRRSIAQP